MTVDLNAIMDGVAKLQARMDSVCAKADASLPPDNRMYVEFDKLPGRFNAIPSLDDKHIEAAAKRLGIWKGDPQPFPVHTIWQNKEEVGGG